ncbi:MAG: preprotein translocase subunit SecE [Oscillospiraceae bacterium]|nr:preprotein translocase subunit SecE [Oscillospiraceae bacterium]
MAEKKTATKKNTAASTKAKSTKADKTNKGRAKKYFRDVRSEFKKITWPTKKQVWNNTIVVLVTVLIFGIIIWTLDYLLVSGRDLLMGLF